MTIQQIITWVDRAYPNQELQDNQLLDLNDMYKEIFLKIRTLDNSYKTDNFVTVASQEVYDLQADCNVDKIISVTVDGDRYNHCGINDTIIGNQYVDMQDGTIKLLNDGVEVSKSDLVVKVSYYPQPEELTSFSQEPLLNKKYHNLLKYALAQSMAAQGNNPDIEMANYYQAKYDEFMVVVKNDLGYKATENPTQKNQLVEGW